jgi:tetratricopeptide (TPR) repeat protein
MEGAVAHHQEALETARTIGAAHLEAQALRCLGRAELSLGQLDSAAEHLRAAVTTATRIHDLDEVVEAHTVLADVLVAAGNTDQARDTLRAASDAISDHPGHRRAETINRRLADSADLPAEPPI